VALPTLLAGLDESICWSRNATKIYPHVTKPALGIESSGLAVLSPLCMGTFRSWPYPSFAPSLAGGVWPGRCELYCNGKPVPPAPADSLSWKELFSCELQEFQAAADIEFVGLLVPVQKIFVLPWLL
jgi:hypothetical protein